MPSHPAMRIDCALLVRKEKSPLGGGGVEKYGKTTFLWGVKIFYFSLFLEIASCIFVGTKIDLPTLWDIVSICHFDMSF